MKTFLKLIGNECGATAVEYASIASLISIAAIGAVASIGGKVDTMFAGLLGVF